MTTLDAARREASHRLPHVLPGGDAVLFTIVRRGPVRWDQTEIAVYSRRTRKHTIVLTGGADARYISTGPSTGYVVYVREGVLMAAPFDLTRLAAGTATPVLGNVMQAAYHAAGLDNSGVAQLSLSDTGTLAYVPGGTFPEKQRSLVLVDRSGGEKDLNLPRLAFLAPRLSPDGQRLAVSTIGGREEDILVSELARPPFDRIRTTGATLGIPVWTPNGQRIVYRSDEGGRNNLFWRPADGTGEERLTQSPNSQAPGAWTPNGTVLAFYQAETVDDVLHYHIWLFPVVEKKQPRRLTQSNNSSESGADFSPDGRAVAYASNSSGQFEVYVQPYPGPGPRRAVSIDGGYSPVWRPNGRELFYIKVGPTAEEIQVMSVPIATTPELRVVGVPQPLFHGRYLRSSPAKAYDVMPDGERFLMVRQDLRPACPLLGPPRRCSPALEPPLVQLPTCHPTGFGAGT